MKKNLAVMGMQFGDEGKGKVVDHYASQFKCCARWCSSQNAGHTIVVNDKKIITHMVPSGIVQNKISMIGSSCVFNVDLLKQEIQELEQAGCSVEDNLLISEDCHLIFDYHRNLDGAREEEGKNFIGTTKRGVGPVMEAKVGRRGIRVADLWDQQLLKSKLELNAEVLNPELEKYGKNIINPDVLMFLCDTWRSFLSSYVVRTEILRKWINENSTLFEGAQAVGLDINFGTYPHITSTSVLPGEICNSFGLKPKDIHEVIGVVKAYPTRVGAGAFPTKIKDEREELLRKLGNEFGATTGRPRICAWLDLPMLKNAAEVAGIDRFALTKMDILIQLGQVEVCVDYSKPNINFTFEPDDLWRFQRSQTIMGMPKEVRRYIDLIEEQTGVVVSDVSTGADRNQYVKC